MRRNAKLRKEQKWAIEKPKLDFAGRVLGIYFIDPEDKEFKEAVKNARNSSGRPASDLGWRSSSKTAPGSLSTGSPAGRPPPHGNGSMYSQANVKAGTEGAAAPNPSVAVRDRGY